MCPHIIPSPRHVYTHSPTPRPPIHASVCPSVSAFVASRTFNVLQETAGTSSPTVSRCAHPREVQPYSTMPLLASITGYWGACFIKQHVGWWTITFSSQLCPSEGRSSQPWRRCLQKGRWLGGTSLFLSPLTREA